MKITLKLFATFRRYLPPQAQGSAFELDVPVGSSVADVLSRFEVPTDGAAVLLVNGRTADPGQVLEEGDALAAFPAMAGG
ncbi:MAG: MoaD/ThiS family protein [Anaerolineae bacterium]|jgi:molybdopterin converting factor small subunit